MKNYKIAVAGTGYVGLSLGVLLSQHHQVVAVDIVQAKVDMINNKKSPIQDDYIEKYLAEKDLNAVILQVGCFGKANVPYYTYQDLAVEALVEMKIKNDPALEYSTYQDIALKDLQRRANEQMEVYQSASGVFTMGKWLAEYLIQTGKLPREKVHAVGGGTNILPLFGRSRRISGSLQKMHMRPS